MNDDFKSQGASTFPKDPFRLGLVSASNESVLTPGTTDVVVGVISEAIPHARCYGIQVAGRPPCIAVALSQTSLNTAHGVNDINMYQIGTPVLVAFLYNDNIGMILGTIPKYIYDNNLVVPPTICTASDIGITEPAFQYHVEAEDKNRTGVVNFAAGAATDSIPGDWGAMNELGVGLLVSKFMAFLRASENCGLSVFYLDKLLRLHAYNYEYFTASSEHRIYNDEQEVHDVHFRSKFPWEALGVSKYGTDPFTENSGEDGAWKAGNVKGYLEPQSEDQTGIWRDVELRGYLGDLHRQTVATPGDEFEETPITMTDNESTQYAGLSEIIRSANGAIGIRSAKEIILAKYNRIPVPQQKRLPDDNVEGDWRANYKASNAVGSGDTADDMTDFDWGAEDLADVRPALLLDYLAWTFNFHKLENLLAHKNDWHVPEESDTISKWELERGYIEADKLQELDGNYWAGMPTSVDIDVDSRLTGQKYYESMSAISMLDDGSVVIEDGWGSSITMHRGNIQISCAGDVFCRPGRSFYAFAPKDAMLKAGGSIDLTATNHDIRFKAEKNLQLLAGNGGEGGMLLECRSDGTELDFTEAGENTKSGGILFKASKSDIAMWSNNMYLGTKDMEGTAGAIVISAGEGEQDVLIKGNKVIREIGEAAVDTIGEDKVNVFSSSSTVLDTDSLVVKGSGYFTDGGSLYVDEQIGASGNLIVDGSGIFGDSVSDGADDPHDVLPNRGDFKGIVGEQIDFQEESAQATIDSNSSAADDLVQEFEEGDGAIGSEQTVKDVNFSLRTDDDYNARGFAIFPARWQQLLAEGGGGNTWTEKAVTAGSNTTYPFPGRSAHEGGEAYYPSATLKYFSLSRGYAEDRGEDGSVYKDRNIEDQGSAGDLNGYTTTVPVE